jgi:rod shape determining protein RodA
VNGATLREVLRRVDRPTAIASILLALAGVATTASAAGEGSDLWRGQAKFLLAGVALWIPVVLTPYARLLRYAGLAYAGLLAALVLVLFVGPVINGSQRWLKIGFAFQPSEPLKVVLLLVLARMRRFGRPMRSWLDWLPSAALIALPVALVARQPDLGTALLYLPASFAVLFCGGLPRRHLVVLLAVGLLAGAVTFQFLLKPYQRERIFSTVFRERLLDYEKAREGYQLGRSLLAIRNGDLLGHGFGEGAVTQSGRLPYAYSDFAFAAVAEEGGFVGAASLLLLVLALVLAILRTASLARDPAARALCVGIGVLIASQTAVNVGVATGVVPTTGVPLPFVSHGGSALVTFLVAAGLVLNVSVHRVNVLSGAGDDR